MAIFTIDSLASYTLPRLRQVMAQSHKLYMDFVASRGHTLLDGAIYIEPCADFGEENFAEIIIGSDSSGLWSVDADDPEGRQFFSRRKLDETQALYAICDAMAQLSRMYAYPVTAFSLSLK